jgi:3-dehydroquinate synthase
VSDRIEVTAAGGAYPVLVEPGLARRLAGLLPSDRAALVIADANTAELLGTDLADRLGAPLFELPAGEASKTLAWVERACSAAAAAGLDRDALIVAVGGGVVGDLAGVVAATYLRGVGLVHVPTTLLAQVDSAIGGKAAVNLPEGKNLVGAFKPPEAVYVDPELLAGLPEREFRSGLAEVAKYALIADSRLFDLLRENSGAVVARTMDLMTAIIARCCEIKAGVVSRDEREDGERAILNYGHTVGHALETALGYGVMTHGEAISVGMEVAARLGLAAGVTPADLPARQGDLLRAFGLPLAPATAPATVGVEALLRVISRDKKARAGEVRWVLLDRLGHATAGHRIDPAVVGEVLAGSLP